MKAAKLMHSRLIRFWKSRRVAAALCAPQITAYMRTTDERHKVTCPTCMEILWDEEIAASNLPATADAEVSR